MTGSVHSEIAVASPDAPRNTGALIASLRAAGAARFDPVHWHYLETLAERAATHQGSVQRMLDAKLAQALAVFNARFEQARCEANDIVVQSVQQYPQAVHDLQRLFDESDFKGLRRMLASLQSREQCASLSALVRQLEQHSPEQTAVHVEGAAKPRAELKTIRNFRTTWAKLSADKQVAQALAQAPKNAGPINSHMLVLRSLALMRDISPDYLNRFISYADTLLCLEYGEKEKLEKPKTSEKPKKRAAAKAARK